MDAFIYLIDATYCRSSHHRLALDALSLLQCPHTRRWQRIILKHYKDFLEGSKAPDKEFKDFRNHVLHVRQNNWGGAPGTANEWYHLTIEAARQQAWRNVAYSAGVLSHYITDVIHPFHTGQSDEETNIHRAFEWSTCKAFRQIRPVHDVVQGLGALQLPESDDWLEEAMITGAQFANQHYETLIREYDFQVGKSWPAQGLNDKCRHILGELIQYASRLFALILSRALEEADAYPPQVYLYPEAIFATAKAPVRVTLKAVEDVQVRYELIQMYDEWERTGKVLNYLPEDDREIRNLLQAEMARAETQSPEKFDSSPNRAVEPVRRNVNISAPQIVQQRETTPKTEQESTGRSKRAWKKPFQMIRSRLYRDENEQTAAEPIARKSSRLERDSSPKTHSSTPQERERSNDNRERRESSRNVRSYPKVREDSNYETNSSQPSPAQSNRSSSSRQSAYDRSLEPRENQSRFYLTLADDVEAAPSIGAKTAKRLERVGINTVNDLLNMDAAALSRKLDVSWITRDVVQDWQEQAVLVCRIPGLRGHDAQLLVANDYRDVTDVAAANSKELYSEVNRFCQTSAGQRIIRSGKRPDKEEIREWIQAAQQARSLAEAA